MKHGRLGFIWQIMTFWMVSTQYPGCQVTSWRAILSKTQLRARFLTPPCFILFGEGKQTDPNSRRRRSHLSRKALAVTPVSSALRCTHDYIYRDWKLTAGAGWSPSSPSAIKHRSLLVPTDSCVFSGVEVNSWCASTRFERKRFWTSVFIIWD